MIDDVALREEVIATALAMNAAGINRGKSGNVSVRLRRDGFDGFLVTPSGLPYADTVPGDIVAMTLAGDAEGDPFATSLACLHRPIPPFHYMVAVAGGTDIRCAPYATFGTQALSDHAVAALADRRACLLANHGTIALGSSLPTALALAVEVETLAEMYWRVLQIGEPILLSEVEMAVVLDRFATYGQPPSGRPPSP